MRSLLALAASLLIVQVAHAESFTVRIQESVNIEISGATAAYTTNPLIADVVVAAPGRLAVTGHGSGTTQLMVITANGTQSFLITVAAAQLPTTAAPVAGAPRAQYDGHYSSGSATVQNAVYLRTGDLQRHSEFSILHIHDLNTAPDQPSDSIATMFYRRTTRSGALTLLDETVDLSRMTVNNTQVRGVHLRQGPLEIHAGYASSAMYDDLFLHTDRRWVGGAGYGIVRGSTLWTPSVYGFFSEPADTAARRGVVGALSVQHREGETLFARADLGVSRSLAASGELRFFSLRDQFRALLSVKPPDFPTLGLSDVPGDHATLDWIRRSTDRMSITSGGSFDRFDLPVGNQTIGAANVGFSYALTSRLNFLAGATGSDVRTPTTSMRTIGLPLGLTYEGPGAGLAVSYRLLDNSEASSHGDMLRVSAHAGSGRFAASAWAERDRQAPTLELIFNAEPGLELALLRLGISVRNPEDVARALRDNAALIDLGFITGVNISLAPRRLQAGFNLGWIGSSARSDHLRLLAVYSRDEGISSTRDSMIGTFTYSRRILTATDLYGSYSWWRTGLIGHQQTGTSVDIGLRQQFTGVPDFLRRSGTIEGFVFLDPQMLGVRGPGTQPLPDLAVTLDGNLTQRTDSQGAYAFKHVPPGRHQIAALLPPSPPAFFTTPSHSETNGPAHVDFGLVWAAARVDGRVISDAGIGIPGAVLTATAQGVKPISATTDSEGGFVLALPPGTFRVGVAAESLPVGYVIAGERERSVAAAADQPQSLSFEVQALRSIAGRAAGASEVRIESLGRTAPVDSGGNFVFRSMPSGTFALTARSAGRTVGSAVTLPAEPAIVSDVVLGAAPSAIATTSAPPSIPVVLAGKGVAGKEAASHPSTAPAIRHEGAFSVAAGAFRLPQNTSAIRQRIESLGAQVKITRRGSLDLVTVGLFASREEAESEAARLRAAGLDAAVVTERGPVSSAAGSASNGSYVVQAGAFRQSRYARELIDRLQQQGEHPFTVVTHGLTLVYIGPFETRRDADRASERVRRAGFEGFATRR